MIGKLDYKTALIALVPTVLAGWVYLNWNPDGFPAGVIVFLFFVFYALVYLARRTRHAPKVAKRGH